MTTTQTKHTPGPWHVVQNGRKIDIHAKCFEEKRELTIACDVREKYAKLIAAAPEMLSALESMIEYLEIDCGCGNNGGADCNACMAAKTLKEVIAKAKREE